MACSAPAPSRLQAGLSSPALTHAQRRALWARTTATLARPQPWLEVGSRSPLIVWEKVVTVLLPHRTSFPSLPTAAPIEALDSMLACQDPATGGVHSGMFDAPNAEETALALFAFKCAARHLATDDPARASVARDAARRAQAYLEQRLDVLLSPSYRHPSLWMVNLPYTPTNVTRAIIVGSLEALTREAPAGHSPPSSDPISPISSNILQRGVADFFMIVFSLLAGIEVMPMIRKGPVKTTAAKAPTPATQFYSLAA